MNENLSEAFIILAVGMITVFAILFLVVLTGQTLIKLTNRYAPVQPIKEQENIPLTTINNNLNPPNPNTINKNKLAAIVGAVEHLTQGKGRIEKIEKL